MNNLQEEMVLELCGLWYTLYIKITVKIRCTLFSGYKLRHPNTYHCQNIHAFTVAATYIF